MDLNCSLKMSIKILIVQRMVLFLCWGLIYSQNLASADAHVHIVNNGVCMCGTWNSLFYSLKLYITFRIVIYLLVRVHALS